MNTKISYVISAPILLWCINEYKRMFILTDRKSFDAVDGCVRQVREARHDDVAILIVGNKMDLQVQIYLN